MNIKLSRKEIEEGTCVCGQPLYYKALGFRGSFYYWCDKYTCKLYIVEELKKMRGFSQAMKLLRTREKKMYDYKWIINQTA